MAPISLIIDYITSHLIPGSRTHGCINTAVLYINTTHVQPRPLLGAGQTGVWLYWGRGRQVSAPYWGRSRQRRRKRLMSVKTCCVAEPPRPWSLSAYHWNRANKSPSDSG